MPHRSNQAVASQDQALQPPHDPPPPRRPPFGWPTALGFMGAGAVLLAAGLWFGRIPLAEGLIKAELANRGAEADFRIVNLDLNGATLAAVRLGPEEAPDAAIGSADLTWRWRWLSPELESVRLAEPRLRLKIDPAGRVSAGALEQISTGEPRRRPVIPRLRLDVDDGQALIEAPFGAVTASFHAAGVLGRDFSALAQIAPTTRPGETHALSNGAAELSVTSAEDGLAFRFVAHADDLVWTETGITGVELTATGQAPLDLSSARVQAAWRADSVRGPGELAANGLSGALRAESAMQEDALAPESWRGEISANAARFAVGEQTLQRAVLNARAEGAESNGAGAWTINGARFAGLGLVSESPAAGGEFRFDLRGDERLDAQAHIQLARAALNAEAQQNLRDAFPNIETAPVGPTFAQAERALDAAADRFDLTASATFALGENSARLAIDEPIQVRAASGAVLNITPARADTSALVLQWPGPSLGGGVSIELSGGGAPHATLLLDTITWTENAPFEAEGTLSIDDWRAQNASIAAQDLNVALALPPNGGGRIDLVGPARITGPVGDGQVRDLVADLDLAASWGDAGWRVTPNQGCLPVRLGGLDVAGLSFAAGAFRLCAGEGGALIAADSAERLSGGFVIQTLALNGHMAGPEGQPARLGAARVNGRFSGTADQARLLVEAATPAIAVEMDDARTILVQGERLTADALIGDGTWRVEGAFEAGTLEDPGMPGAVSTIAGRWNAAPEDEHVVIRVEAGEAFINAREAPIDAEDRRPLFNPVRLTEIEAELREGRINAHGRVVLDEGARALATFTAEHDTESGEGVARVVADNLVFDRNLQPYEISELARGLFENVRGHASATAEARWANEDFRVTGVVRPNGLSLSMATIPIIENVSGEVVFDDLLTLTTTPGQTLSIGELNPGVAVHNGQIRFQLLPEQRVAIEQAAFEFAEGVLAVAPTTITLGAEETRFNLTLSDVDVAALLDQLNMQDLSATGRVEGSFPMLLTARTAFIENGELHAAPGGGAIAYTGNAGDNVTGAARVAFDALRSFRYDDLRLTLNGDLSGEVVSSIQFSGENTGRPVDLSPISGSPIGAVNARGVPFAFRVTLTAPFRQLARTAAGVINPGDFLGEALERQEHEEQEEKPPETQTAPSVDVQVDGLR